jgi:hypothetical protein
MNRFTNFLAALNITDEARKKALLLHYGGEGVFEIFETLDSTARVLVRATATDPAVVETVYEAALRSLNDHFTPRVNADFEMFTFRQASQFEGETIDAFHTRLQQMARNCNFGDKDREVKAQLTIGCTSTDLRRKILEKPAMTLEVVRRKARALEAAETQAEKMEKETEQAALAIKHNSSTRNRPKRQDNQTETNNRTNKPVEIHDCLFCGGLFHTRLSSCPARFHQCKNCLNLHHFENLCRSPRRERPYREGGERTNAINTDESDSGSDEEELAYQAMTRSRKCSLYEVAIDSTKVSVIADSGSTVTLLDQNTYYNMGCPALKPTSVKIYTYGSPTFLRIQGKLDVEVTYNGRGAAGTAYICPDGKGNLLSGKIATLLGLLNMADTAADSKDDHPRVTVFENNSDRNVSPERKQPEPMSCHIKTTGAVKPLDNQKGPCDDSPPPPPDGDGKHKVAKLPDVDDLPPLPSDDEEEWQNQTAPPRRESHQKKRPDPLHYVGGGIRRKKKTEQIFSTLSNYETYLAYTRSSAKHHNSAARRLLPLLACPDMPAPSVGD